MPGLYSSVLELLVTSDPDVTSYASRSFSSTVLRDESVVVCVFELSLGCHLPAYLLIVTLEDFVGRILAHGLPPHPLFLVSLQAVVIRIFK